MIKHRYREYLFEQYLELLLAVYRQAVVDARKGDTEALEFIQDTAPNANREVLLTIRHRDPRRRSPALIQMN